MGAALVTCYQNPDLDGFAGAIAYAELLNRAGREARVGIFGEPHDEVHWVMEKFRFAYPPAVHDPQRYKEVVLVDASDARGIDKRIAPDQVREIIDHRIVNESAMFPRASVHIEAVGAAATLIAERFQKLRLEPSRQSAILLAAAIISNTLDFKAQITTDRDRAAFAWLQRQEPLPDHFAREMFLAKSDLKGKKLIQRMQSEIAAVELQGRRLSIIRDCRQMPFIDKIRIFFC